MTELLTLTLRTTIDLICQIIYGVELSLAQFDILAACMSDYITPGFTPSFQYPDCHTSFSYHAKVGVDMGKEAKVVTVAQIIRDSDMPQHLKDANLGFCLEAITPAFASFWILCHIFLDKSEAVKNKCMDNPVYRQQCINQEDNVGVYHTICSAL
jgi:hypothetical protein